MKNRRGDGETRRRGETGMFSARKFLLLTRCAFTAWTTCVSTASPCLRVSPSPRRFFILSIVLHPFLSPRGQQFVLGDELRRAQQAVEPHPRLIGRGAQER